MYEPRWYRDNMGERFRTLSYSYLESDIWLAFDVNNTTPEKNIIDILAKKIRSLRNIFEQYFILNPQYKTSLEPINTSDSAPLLVSRLAECSKLTKVGPMAGIAGLFAQEIGEVLKEKFSFNEIIVENGGDLYIDVMEELTVKLYAGEHPLSNKLNLKIYPENTPLGLCASSGKFGHSTNFGHADLVAVACPDTVMADQLATKFANEVKQAEDIKKVIDNFKVYEAVKHISIFAFNAFAMAGELQLVDESMC